MGSRYGKRKVAISFKADEDVLKEGVFLSKLVAIQLWISVE